MSSLDIRYTAAATADDGRDGRVTTDDGALDLQISPPDGVDYKVKSMRRDLASAPGAVQDDLPVNLVSNPEQLFAAGYSASFHGALGAVAVVAGLDVRGSTVTAKVGLGKDENEGLGLAIELCVSVPGVDEATVRKLARYAHQIDPYSIAMRGNIDVTLTVA